MPLAQWLRRLFPRAPADSADARRRRADFVTLRVRRMDERRVFSVTAVNGGADATLNEGGSYALPPASFTDTAPTTAPYTASVDWGDGSTVQTQLTGLTIDAAAKTVSGSHTYADNGTFTVTITVTGTGGSSAVDTVQVTVNNVAPTVDAHGPYRVNPDGTVQLNGTATDPGGANDPLTYLWDLDNDGIFGETGAAAGNGNETGQTPTFDADGLAEGTVVDISLRVTDGDGGQTTVNTTVTVNASPTVSTIADQKTNRNTAVGPIAFTIGDDATAPGSLTVTASSSNTGVVANNVASLALGGSGADRTLTVTPVNNASGTTDISIVVTDAEGQATVRTFTLIVNDPPTITTTVANLIYAENATATAVDASLGLTDGDSSTLAGATVQITGNYANGQDLLEFATQNGITGAWNVADGKLTLSGSATVNNYRAALRSVTYRNTSDNPSTAARTVTFIADDGIHTSVAKTRGITVTALNDPPTVTPATGTLAYTENDGAKVIDAALAVADPDTAMLTSATVQITGNYSNGQDFLEFTNQNGITHNWTVGTGLLTLSGSATPSDYQTALRSVTYRNSSDTPSTTNRTVTIQVFDGTALSTAVTRTITVAAVNDPPELTTTLAALAYTENDAATAIDTGLTIVDDDDTSFTRATVQITDNYATGEDVLAFTNQSGIIGSWNAINGTMTLSGTATLANYRTALRSVTYRNTSESPGTLTRTVTFILNDGDDDSNEATRDITIAAVNDRPVVTTTSGSLAYTENAAATAVDAALNVSDDGATLTGATVQITDNYANGQDLLEFTDQNGISGAFTAVDGKLTLSGTASVNDYKAALRSVTYRNTSDAPSTANRTVTFIANDGLLGSNPVTRGITVTAVNDAPVVTTTTAALPYAENAAATAIDPALELTDADSANLTGAVIKITANYVNGQDVLAFTNQNGITGAFDAAEGKLTLSGSSSVANYRTALRSVTYRNTSDNPSTLARTVTFTASDATLTSAEATRDITIAASNDAPVISTTGGNVAYVENAAAVVVDSSLGISDGDNTTFASATVEITGNHAGTQDVLEFTDQNGITGSFNAAAGRLTLTGNASLADYRTALRSVTYRNTSDNPSTATRTVTFKINDGTDDSAGATRGIAVTALNDAPTLTPTLAALSYTENAPATAVDAGIAVADADNTNLASAVVQITGNYVNGQDLLEFTNQNGISGTWTVGTGTLALNGTSSVANYQAALRSITYRNTSDTPSTVTRTVTFRVNDGTVNSADATRDINIVSVNDPPIVTTTGGSLAYTENGPPAAIDGGLNITDADGSTLVGAVVRIRDNYAAGQDLLVFADQNGIGGMWNPTTGTLTLSGSASLADYRTALRSVAYRNTSDDPSTLTRCVAFTVNDGAAISAEATRDITVTAVNDAPTITAIAAVRTPQFVPTPPLPFTIADVDTPEADLMVTATSSSPFVLTPADIVLAGNGADWTVTVVPPPSVHGIFDITITVDDGAGGIAETTFTLTISDPPTFQTPPTDAEVDEDPASVPQSDFTVADTETPPGDLLVSATSDNQTLVANADIQLLNNGGGNWTIVAGVAPNRSGTAVITIVVTDEDGVSTAHDWTVKVNPVNDPPSASGQVLSTSEDTDLSGVLTGSDGDIDVVQGLTFRIVTAPRHGTITSFNIGTGAFTYRPAANYSGDDSFEFLVRDDNTAGDPANIESMPATVTIFVDPVADPPTFQNVLIRGDEFREFIPQLRILLVDADGSETMTIEIDNVPEDVSILDPGGVEFGRSINLDGTKCYQLTPAQYATASFFALDNLTGVVSVTAVATEQLANPLSPVRTATATVNVPLTIVNVPPRILGLSGPPVGSDAVAAITAIVSDAPDDTFSVVITWGKSTIGFTQQSAFPNLGPQLAFLFAEYQFLTAPDPSNPAAPVVIEMVVTDKDGGTTTESITVEVSGTGIPVTVTRSLTVFEAPVLFRVFSISEVVESRVTTTPVVTVVEAARAVVRQTTTSTRSVILRTVSTGGAESEERYQLPALVLNDLPSFLRKLPDGRYRLYLAENEFTPPRVLVDVVVFRGRAVAPGDLQSGRPPMQVDSSHDVVGKSAAVAPRVVDSVPVENARAENAPATLDKTLGPALAAPNSGDGDQRRGR